MSLRFLHFRSILLIASAFMLSTGLNAQTVSTTIYANGTPNSFKTGSVNQTGTKNDGNMVNISQLSGNNRGWAVFDMSVIPPASTITAVTIKFTTFSGVTSGAANNIYGFVGDPATMSGTALFAACQTGTSFHSATWTSSGLHTWPFNAAGVSFIDANVGNPNTVIGFVRGSTNTYNIYGYPATSNADKPQLEITYIPGTPCAGQPNAGTVSSSVTIACATQAFTLTLNGSTAAANINYQWQSRVGTSGPWTNIAGATSTSTSVTQAATSQYRAYVVCTNSNLADTSQPITVQQGPCYCLPTYSNTFDQDAIVDVQLGVLSHNTLNDANPVPCYKDYTGLQPGTLAIPDIKQGQNYNVGLTFGNEGSQYSAVWIDFDQDGTFNTTDEYFTTGNNAGSGGSLNVPITVPVTAAIGWTRMRIRGGDDNQPSANQACGASNSTWGEAEDYLVNVIPACDPPTVINVTNITPTTATGSFTQNNPTPPIGYEYAVTTSATPPASGTFTGTSTNNFSSLTPNTTYYLHVRTNCSPTLTSGWATVSFTTSDLNCAVSPSNLAATNITYNSADLSWNAIGGVTGYEYIVDQNLLPPATGSGTPIAATTFNTGATLAHGTTYYLHVRTECTGPTYSSWTTLAFTTLLCDTPNVSNATNITVNSADVWWNPVPGVLGYEYDVSPSANPPASGTFTTNLLEPVTGLTAGTTYYLHVRTNCDVNVYSPWKTYSFTTLPCSAVTPVVSALAFNSATISWNSLPGAPAYEYDFGTNATPPTGAGTSTPGLFYNATGLTPNTTYYLHVRAQCGPGTFSPWSTVSFTTLTCLPPIGLSITNVTVGSATLSWSAPNPPSSVGQGSPATASSYEYIVDQSNAVPGGAGVNIPGTVVMVTNTSAAPITTLQPDTWYYVHLRSICYPNGGISDWILDSFKTLEPCPPVQNLRTEHVWFDEIDVLWDAVPYALYYQYSIGTSSQPPTQGTNITTTSFRARGLKDNTVYYAHVRSICSDVPNSIWETTVFKTSSLSVSNVNGSGSTMEVYPNPARNVVTVHVAGADGGMIELTDATGKLVHSQAVTSPDTQVDIHALSSGIYLLKYRDEDGRQQIEKLTKE